jgi:hypothetical protein
VATTESDQIQIERAPTAPLCGHAPRNIRKKL